MTEAPYAMPGKCEARIRIKAEDEYEEDEDKRCQNVPTQWNEDAYEWQCEER